MKFTDDMSIVSSALKKYVKAIYPDQNDGYYLEFKYISGVGHISINCEHQEVNILNPVEKLPITEVYLYTVQRQNGPDGHHKSWFSDIATAIAHIIKEIGGNEPSDSYFD